MTNCEPSCAIRPGEVGAVSPGRARRAARRHPPRRGRATRSRRAARGRSEQPPARRSSSPAVRTTVARARGPTRDSAGAREASSLSRGLRGAPGAHCDHRCRTHEPTAGLLAHARPRRRRIVARRDATNWSSTLCCNTRRGSLGSRNDDGPPGPPSAHPGASSFSGTEGPPGAGLGPRGIAQGSGATPGDAAMLSQMIWTMRIRSSTSSFRISDRAKRGSGRLAQAGIASRVQWRRWSRPRSARAAIGLAWKFHSHAVACTMDT